MNNENKGMEKKGILKYLFIVFLVLGLISIGVGIVGNFTFWKDDTNTGVNDVESGEESNDSLNGNVDGSDDSKKFDGSLSFEPRKSILDDFNVTIPEGFTSFFDVVTSLDMDLVTDSSQSLSSCNIHFGEIINYDFSSLELANQMVEYFGVKESLNEKEINEIKWYNFQYESVGSVDSYLTEKNGKLYLFEYKVEANAKPEVCNKYMPDLINSVSYKK